MCGLSALVEFGSGGGALRSLLAMHDQIEHRGPDAEGFAVWDTALRGGVAGSRDQLRGSAPADLHVGFAFRWLKIQDPTAPSAQPMMSADGSVCLIYNGEIYNFRELREELRGLGHRFSSVGDTEVVLAAYLQWGVDCFSRLNGMWAIVVLDRNARKLVMSRDRFGIKPLFYHLGGGRLIIASEVKQIIAAGVAPDANRPAVVRFIRGVRPERTEETFFQNIFAQPAATYAEIALSAEPSEITFTPYWKLEPKLRKPVSPLADATSELERILQASVDEHMLGQAKLGHLISGGLDSSLLAALAAPAYSRRGEQGLGASMVLDDPTERTDETVYIDQISKALDFKNSKSELSPAWLKANLARATWTQEEPLAGLAVAGQFLAYETAARQGLRVVLDGQGSDELFAGYPRHQLLALTDWFRHGAFGRLLRELLCLIGRDPGFFPELWRLRIMPRLARHLGIARKSKAPDFILPLDLGPVVAVEQSPSMPATALTRALMTDVLTYNLKSTLAFTDRNSMAHAIEARVPYIDRRVVEFAFALPDNYKIGGGERKHILRRMAQKYLPRSIVRRVDRIGFGVPIERWLTTDFRVELGSLADSASFAKSSLVDPQRLRRYVDGFLAGRHRDAGTVWRLYALDLWAKAYSVTNL